MKFNLLFCIAFLVLNSCGSRKVKNSVVKDYLTTEKTNTKINDISVEVNAKTFINNESDEIEITPIDTAKVLIINGKEFKNAKIKISSKKTQTKTEVNRVIVDKTKTENKAITDIKNKTVTKDIERKFNLFTWLIWLLIPAILYLIWKFRPRITI